MDKAKINNVCTIIDSMSYVEKREVFSKCFPIGGFLSDNLDDKLVLISLVALTYKKLKEKHPDWTVLDVLLMITGERESTSPFYAFLVSLAIYIEELIYECPNISACGLTNSKDIINKIKELLGQWIPF